MRRPCGRRVFSGETQTCHVNRSNAKDAKSPCLPKGVLLLLLFVLAYRAFLAAGSTGRAGVRCVFTCGGLQRRHFKRNAAVQRTDGQCGVSSPQSAACLCTNLRRKAAARTPSGAGGLLLWMKSLTNCIPSASAFSHAAAVLPESIWRFPIWRDGICCATGKIRTRI